MNPFFPSPFIEDDVENYGTLWSLNYCVKSWTFSKVGKHVQIIVNVNDDIPFVHLNRFERVTFVEQQRREYVVLGVQPFNEAGVDLPHCHSLVVKVGITLGQFSFGELLDSVMRNEQGALKEAFEKYVPWTNDDAEKVNRRLV